MESDVETRLATNTATSAEKLESRGRWMREELESIERDLDIKGFEFSGLIGARARLREAIASLARSAEAEV